MKQFEDLIAWQKAKELSVSVYRITADVKDYGFNDQIRRASVSIMNNISEGFERQSNNEFRRFLYIAKGSASEVRSMLRLGKELNYIKGNEFTYLVDLSVEISKIISGLIKTL